MHFEKKNYNIIVKDVNDRELYKLKYKLLDLKDTNEKLLIGLAEVVDEMNGLKAKMKERDSDEFASSEILLVSCFIPRVGTRQPNNRVEHNSRDNPITEAHIPLNVRVAARLTILGISQS